MTEARRWKYVFDGEDPDVPHEKPREELTKKQKGWLTRAWEHFSQAELGISGVPNAIPIYNEDEGFAHRPGHETQWHHVVPVGVANRVLGEEYNYPQNIVPVDATNHIGKGLREEDLDDYFVIHEDTWEATQDYRGQKGEDSPYKKMGVDRRIATQQGKIYHNDDYDPYLLELASQVVNLYLVDFPDDPWPEKKK